MRHLNFAQRPLIIAVNQDQINKQYILIMLITIMTLITVLTIPIGGQSLTPISPSPLVQLIPTAGYIIGYPPAFLLTTRICSTGLNLNTAPHNSFAFHSIHVL